MSRSSADLFALAQTFLNQGEAFIIVTLLKVSGHAPQDPGAKALITKNGLSTGTVGGGKVEAKAIRYGLELLAAAPLKQGLPEVQVWDLQRDVGMSCGGSVQLLFEGFHMQPWSVVVFGAGHVGQSLVRLLVQLECRITCIDSRPEWIGKLPSAPQLLALTEPDLSQFAADVPPRSYCVVVTQGHASDLPVLRRLLLRQDLPYIGVIGSRVKARILRAELSREGFTETQIRSFFCPMGLDFGSNNPAEIALSITAQMLTIRDAKAHPEAGPTHCDLD